MTADPIRSLSNVPAGMVGADCPFLSSPLLREVFGASSRAPNSGLLAFTYLYRRFGPPSFPGDEGKDIAVWCLTTPDPEVVLWVCANASGLSTWILGPVCTREVRRKLDMDAREIRVREAALGVLRTWLDPVWVRDIPFNALGVVEVPCG